MTTTESPSPAPSPVLVGQGLTDQNFLLSTIDAKIWTDEFCKLNTAADHGTMLGWFACAIMTGFDEGQRRQQDSKAQDGLVMPPTRGTDSQQGSSPFGWIRVEDQLPPENATVAIKFWPYDNHENKQIVGAAEHIGGSFYTHEGKDHHPPSHWCALPPMDAEQSSMAGSARQGGNTNTEPANFLATSGHDATGAATPIGFIARETLKKLQGGDLGADEPVRLWHAENPPSRAVIPVFLAATAPSEADKLDAVTQQEKK